MADKSVGYYAELDLVDAEGNVMEKHMVRLPFVPCPRPPTPLPPIPSTTTTIQQARDFHPQGNVAKRPDQEVWVVGMWGNKFGIKVSKHTHHHHPPHPHPRLQYPPINSIPSHHDHHSRRSRP